MLADLDWILGTPDSPIREQVAEIFLRAGLAPPTPSVQSDSSKLIGEMIVASDRDEVLVKRAPQPPFLLFCKSDSGTQRPFFRA